MKSKNRSFSGIANLVKKYRLQHSDKLSQVELSNLLGYKNGQFISNVERGICAIPLKALKDLVRILSIPEDELLAAMVKDYEQTIINHMRDGSPQSDFINGPQGSTNGFHHNGSGNGSSFLD
jgi:transcriptional regulator with XRE-family HTH domain